MRRTRSSTRTTCPPAKTSRRGRPRWSRRARLCGKSSRCARRSFPVLHANARLGEYRLLVGELNNAPVAVSVTYYPRRGVAASDLLPRRSTQVRVRSPLQVVLPDCIAAAYEWGNGSHVRCRMDAISWRGRAPCAERGGGRVNVAKARTEETVRPEDRSFLLPKK